MKANRSRRRRLFMIANEVVVIITLFFFSTSTLFALPAGQQVVNGQASFNTQGNTLTVKNSPNSIINWQRFSINTNEAVRFIQQSSSSAVLNRVIGPYASNIFGLLQSNGRVFLINPNGIFFGQGARIDVNGFVASTLNISNQDFLAGKYNFTAGTFAGSIQNQGTITTPEGGKVYLIAPDIENSGIINTPKGDVVLAAGHSVQLVDSLDPDIAVVVNAPADRAVNLGQIVAESGRIGIYGGLISQKGIVSADSAVVGENGKIIFKATKDVTLDPGSVTSAKGGGTISILADKQNGTVNVAGTLDASAPNVGDGGFIETSAASVKIADTAHITTLAPFGKTGAWLIDPPDFTIAASGGDITGTALGTNLNSSNVTILSDDGAAGVNGDIFVNDAVTWSSATTLTLNAYRNIEVNQFITATGNGSIVLRSDYSGTGTGTVNFGLYCPGPACFPYTVSFNSASSGSANIYYNPPGGYASPTDYSSNFVNVTPTAYMLVNTVTNLQDVDTNLAGTYALGRDIDASETSEWNDGLGFRPIGDSETSFTGTFDGLGHTITSLYIDRSSTDYVGLFGYTGNSATIRNVNLSNATITGYSGVGGLVGYNNGGISNSSSSSTVSSTGTTASSIGGLVGNNEGTITNSYSTGTVTGTSATSIGGLVGYNEGGISNSYSTGAVTGASGVGGLVGENDGGSVNNSYSTGAVTGTTNVGGLVGANNGKIDSTYSTGEVSGTTNVGGLAGINNGTFDYSYWNTETANQPDGVGSGSSAGVTDLLTAAQMMAQANFSGWDFTNTWRIYEGYTYPLLKIFLKPLTITVNDATKTYDGVDYNGSAGLTGLPPTDVYGTATYPGTRNAGYYSSITPDGLYSVQQGYDITYVSGTLNVNPASLTITAQTNTKTYDGTTTAAAAPIVTGLQAGDSVTGATEAYADKNAGSGKTLSVTAYTVNDGNSGNNYTVATVDNTAGTINPASLTITAQPNTKTYDGTTTAAAAPIVTGLQPGDSVTGATEAYADKNAGSGKTLSVTAYTVNDGNSGNNYTVATVDNTAGTINQAALTITAQTNTKTYDGTTTAAAAPVVSGLQAGDSVTGLIEAYTDKNVGSGNKTLSVTGYTVNDGNSGNNYTVATVDNTAGTINPAALTITAQTNTKTYDGTTTAAAAPVVTGLQAGDSVTGLIEAYTDKNVGSGNKTLSVTGYTVNDGNSGNNYTVATVDNTAGTINQAALTITAQTNTKTYDGTTTAAAAPIVTGLQAGDSVTGATEAYADKNAGSGKTLSVTAYTVNDGNSGNNYTVATVDNTAGTINPASLTITAQTNTKTYDGTTTAAAAPIVTGLQAGDSVTGATEAYADKNAGSGKTLSVTAYTVNDGNSGNNYTVATVDNTAGTINPASLTITAQPNTKTYDGTTTAAAAPIVTGLQPGDSVTGATEAYADKNAGSGKTLSVTAYTVNDGNSGNNYTVATVDNTAGTINQAALTITAQTNTKTYDGTTTAAAAPVVSGLQAGDSVTGLIEAYTDKNVGSGNKTLSVTGYTVNDGNSGNNYTVATVDNTAGTINPAALTITAQTNTKTYDGTTTAAAAPVVSGLQAGDSVTGATEAYADKNAGSGKTLSVTAYTVNDGNSGNNYTVATVDNTAGTINPASLTITAQTNTKTYDGTTTAAAAPIVTGLQAGDSVTGLIEAYTDKNVGSGNKTLSVTAYTVNDGNSGNNYTVATVNNTTGTINPASLTITAQPNTKTYDGTTSAAAAPTITSGTLYDPATLTEIYDNQYIGTGKTLTPAATINDGNNGNNYQITYIINTTGVITMGTNTTTISTEDATRPIVILFTSTQGTAFATVETKEDKDKKEKRFCN